MTPRLLAAELASTPEARRTLTDLPGGIFIRPRFLGGNSATLAMLLRHLDDTGVVRKVAHGVYYKPSSPSDSPSPDVLRMVQAAEVEWVGPDGSPLAAPAPSSPALTREFLQREYVQGGRTTTEIATELGCAAKTVTSALRRFDLPVRPRGRTTPLTPGLTREFLEREYVRGGRSAAEIASELSCTERTIHRALDSLSLPRRSVPLPKEALTRDFLVEHYVTRHLSATQVGLLAGCSGQSVLNALEREGIPRHDTLTHLSERGLTEEYLRRAHCEEGQDVAAIATATSTSTSTVRRALRAYAIPPTRSSLASSLTRETLEEKYTRQNLSAAAIAREADCSPQSVLVLLRSYGIPLRPAPSAKSVLTREFLEREYTAKARSLADIASETGFAPSTVLAALRSHAIPTRTR